MKELVIGNSEDSVTIVDNFNIVRNFSKPNILTT